MGVKRGGRPRLVLIAVSALPVGKCKDTRPNEEAYPGASPLLNAALLTRFARPRRVRKVFWAKGERVRTSAAYPLVLIVMRRRALDLQICDGALNLEARDVQREHQSVRDVRFMADHEHMEHAVC